MNSIAKVVQKLTPEQRLKFLTPLSSKKWLLVPNRDAINKQFVLKDFVSAWGFMSQIALKAEKMDHHPE